ncbi:MAG TPA: hypothetical protein VFE59_35150 [Trebonia sp.]|jgi:hypothetical protein|nr:hypothetical protein [Trebonia sp.]
MGPLGAASQETRLAAFREHHPEWRIFPGEFGTWQAERDDEQGSDTHVRYQLDDLLDVLEERS